MGEERQRGGADEGVKGLRQESERAAHLELASTHRPQQRRASRRGPGSQRERGERGVGRKRGDPEGPPAGRLTRGRDDMSPAASAWRTLRWCRRPTGARGRGGDAGARSIEPTAQPARALGGSLKRGGGKQQRRKALFPPRHPLSLPLPPAFHPAASQPLAPPRSFPWRPPAAARARRSTRLKAPNSPRPFQTPAAPPPPARRPLEPPRPLPAFDHHPPLPPLPPYPSLKHVGREEAHARGHPCVRCFALPASPESTRADRRPGLFFSVLSPLSAPPPNRSCSLAPSPSLSGRGVCSGRRRRGEEEARVQGHGAQYVPVFARARSADQPVALLFFPSALAGPCWPWS